MDGRVWSDPQEHGIGSSEIAEGMKGVQRVADALEVVNALKEEELKRIWDGRSGWGNLEGRGLVEGPDADTLQ